MQSLVFQCRSIFYMFLLSMIASSAFGQNVTDALSYEIEGTFAGDYYINVLDFSLQGFDGFRVTLYPVEAGKTYRINHANKLKGGTMCAYYCVYSTAEVSDMNKEQMIQHGEAMTPEFPNTPYTEITISEGGVCLALAEYGQQMVQTLDRVEYVEVDNRPTSMAAYHYDGKNLYITYNVGGVETVYWFAPCMVNSIFTFYRVGVRTVEREWPGIGGIRALDGISVINATESDNIGPLNVEPGGWCGGNHLYHDANTDKDYLTAKTSSVVIDADGKILSPADNGRAHSFKINVTNEIFDPSVSWENNGTSLSALLSEESATYNIAGNTIEVCVNQHFSDNTKCSLKGYYGMQSMMLDETHIITPLGAFADWTSVDEVLPFLKKDWPEFNRFIEKKDCYLQASWLIDSENGYVDETRAIFNRGSGKSYHKVVDSQNFGEATGMTLGWRGAYTFVYNTETDDENILSYCGMYEGSPAWFLSFKQDYSGEIGVPDCIKGYDMTIYEKGKVSECPDFIVSADQVIKVSADRGASLIYISKNINGIDLVTNNSDPKSDYFVDVFSGRIISEPGRLYKGIYIHVFVKEGRTFTEKVIRR